jgi:hypothetical protein
MEEVLAVYTRPYDPRQPWLCMDEVSKQLEAIRKLRLAKVENSWIVGVQPG